MQRWMFPAALAVLGLALVGGGVFFGLREYWANIPDKVTLRADDPVPDRNEVAATAGAGLVKGELITSVTGKEIALPSPGSKAVVLVFLSTTCPICNAYAPELRRIDEEFSGKGVRLILVQTEADLSGKDAAKHAAEYQLAAPVVLDPEHKLAALTGAEMTPEAVVISPEGKILYRGRIDDRFRELGTDSLNARTTDLRDALGEILAGKTVSKPETEAVGCYIE